MRSETSKKERKGTRASLSGATGTMLSRRAFLLIRTGRAANLTRHCETPEIEAAIEMEGENSISRAKSLLQVTTSTIFWKILLKYSEISEKEVAAILSFLISRTVCIMTGQ